MKEFHLQARCLVGPLAAPERDDVEVQQSDDLGALRDEAARLADEGFTVWLFHYGPATGPSLTPDKLHLIETLHPDPDGTDRTESHAPRTSATRRSGDVNARRRHLRRA